MISAKNQTKQVKRYRQAYVEIVNFCNLSCSFCPGTVRAKRCMETDEFAHVVKQVKPLVEQVYLHVMGEPLLHPQFPQIIDICSDAHLPVEVTTNGTLLATKAAQSLFDPIVRQVNISLHALHDHLGSTATNGLIDQIIAFTRNALNLRPDLYINYRIWDLTPDVHITRDLILEKIENAFGIKVTPLNDSRRRKSQRLVDRLYIHSDTRFEWPEINSNRESKTIGFCHALNTQFAVLVDGTVVPCCLDRNGVVNLGNCLSEPLVNILNGPRAKAIACGFREGRLIEPLCSQCSYCQRFVRKGEMRKSELKLHNQSVQFIC